MSYNKLKYIIKKFDYSHIEIWNTFFLFYHMKDE